VTLHVSYLVKIKAQGGMNFIFIQATRFTEFVEMIYKRIGLDNLITLSLEL